MSELRAFRHHHTGAVRMSRSDLGWPYEPAGADAGAGGYDSMTVAELKEIGAAKGLEIPSSAKKVEIIEQLKAAGGVTTGTEGSPS